MSMVGKHVLRWTYMFPLGRAESVDLNVLKTFFNEQINCSQIYEHFKQMLYFMEKSFRFCKNAILRKIVFYRMWH